jgi:hypothetical protein
MLLLTLCLVCGAVALTACAPRSSSDSQVTTIADAQSSNDAVEDVFAAAWSPESDCLVCHASAEPNTLGTIHQELGTDCLVCHNADELTTIHAEHGDSGRTPTRLRYSKMADTTCLSSDCHTDRASLTTRTADVLITDKNGLSMNPHDLPSSSEHEALRCASCHSMHEESDTFTVAQRECFGCHHQQVFECGTCH